MINNEVHSQEGSTIKLSYKLLHEFRNRFIPNRETCVSIEQYFSTSVTEKMLYQMLNANTTQIY
jgi:hypothetical protein